jgi:hypothetical protein
VRLAAIIAVAAATPVPIAPIDVRTLPRLETVDSWWAICGAVASIAAALASIAVAVATYQLAKRTVESVALARQALDAEQNRHMDGFTPHLALRLLHVGKDVSQQMVSPGRTHELKLYVRNIGAGFAQNIVVEDHNVNSDELRKEIPPTALAVGEEALLISKPFGASVDLLGYRLTYCDAFGRKFESRIDGVVRIGARYVWKPLT